MNLFGRFSLILLLFYLHASPIVPPLSAQHNGTFRVVKIVDGDTYDILINGILSRIRMDGIDAPERGQPYYKVSRGWTLVQNSASGICRPILGYS